METFGSFSNEEWECLSKLFAGDQDSDHFSNHDLFSNDHQQDHGLKFDIPSMVSSVMTEANNSNSLFIEDHGFGYNNENINPNFYHYFSQEASNNSSAGYNVNVPTNGAYNHDQVHVFDENYNISSLLAQVLSADDSVDETRCMKQDDQLVPISDQHTLKRKLEMVESPDAVEDKVNDEKKNPKKKTRVTRVNKNVKKVQPKKKQKATDATENINENNVDDTDNKKAVVNAPIASSSSCSSEDDLNGGGENSTWKTRAGRGAATDPQSLYARKRRERINERLKVLQNLVPNGTKVDISTMLEEAVQYVKFLQLQIKLLSSDEMWMYAPIAYNGMDMGLYQKLSQS
ncbi:uncharacterized protein [Rutidosis leptorrhynchoides]|uniref:uncharacterized protein n=1 Tax=Rutidosis leptorrhynchoides TaxID=125765 RepID=UPI003A98F470